MGRDYMSFYRVTPLVIPGEKRCEYKSYCFGIVPMDAPYKCIDSTHVNCPAYQKRKLDESSEDVDLELR